MDSDKILMAADRLLEVKQLLEEAGLASNGSLVRQVEEMRTSLSLSARVNRKRVVA